MNNCNKPLIQKIIKKICILLIFCGIFYMYIFTDEYNINTQVTAGPSNTLENLEPKKIDKRYPNIEANLEKNEIPINNNEATITYTIKADDFDYNQGIKDISLPKDIIILYDTSSKLDDAGIFDKLLMDEKLNNKTENSYKTRYSVITYDEDSEILDTSLSPNFVKNDYDTVHLKCDSESLKDYALQNINYTNKNKQNIGKALKYADEVFDEDKSEDINRYLIIISSGNVIYNEEDLKNIINKNCTVMSINLNSNNGVVNTSLKELQEKIDNNNYIASDENYFINDDNSNNAINEKIKNKILNSSNRIDFTLNDISLNFNLGEDIIPLEGLNKVDNFYKYKVKDIYYKYDKTCNKYKAYNIKTLQYEDKFDIEFKIKININDKKNKYVFVDNNTMSYTFMNQSISKNINTPTIKLKEEKKNTEDDDDNTKEDNNEEKSEIDISDLPDLF